MEPIQWRRAGACDNANICVEVSFGVRGVLMRSSAHPGDVAYFPAEAWNKFIEAIRAGEFDSPEPGAS